MMRCCGLCLVALHLAATTPAAAQTRLVDPRSLMLAPVFQAWTFSTPLASDSLGVESVQQLALPIAFSFSPLRNWRVDVSGAYARSSVDAGDNAGVYELNGLTDAKLRVTGRLLGERVWLTAGLNLPVGRVRLGDPEAATLRVVGAPAFRANTPVLGSGMGLTGGAIYATTLGGWAVGLGLSYELRSSYTALEAALAGGDAATAELDPGDAFHLSLALDRILGQGRLSLLVVGDRYGTDLLTRQPGAGEPPVTTEYSLGPTIAIMADYSFASRRLRYGRLRISERYRAEFRDLGGFPVPGSSGNSLDADLTVALGGPVGAALLLSLGGSLDSGLAVDSSIATAAMRSAVAMLGVELRGRRMTLRPFVQARLGTIDTGATESSLRSLAAGVTLLTEW